MANDVSLWEGSDPTNQSGKPNFGKYSSMQTKSKSKLKKFIDQTNTVRIGQYYMQPAAIKFKGNNNPTVGYGGSLPGDIIVIGKIYHDNKSESVRYRLFDENGSGFTDFVQTYEFLDIARRDADLDNVTADFSRVPDANIAQLEAALAIYRAKIAEIVAFLGLLDSDSYFQVTYTDPNGTSVVQRIQVDEIISWFRRIDFEVYPSSHNFPNGGEGVTDWDNAGFLRRQDITLLIRLSRFVEWSADSAKLKWYLFHEITHATLLGQRIWGEYLAGVQLETRINSIALSIAQALGMDFTDFVPGDGSQSGYGNEGGPYAPDVSVNLVNPPS